MTNDAFKLSLKLLIPDDLIWKIGHESYGEAAHANATENFDNDIGSKECPTVHFRQYWRMIRLPRKNGAELLSFCGAISCTINATMSVFCVTTAYLVVL
jgi:hypothetical protein